MRKLFFFSLLLFASISIAHAIDLSPSINPQIPGVDATGGPSAIIKSFYLFAMALGGALALAMVIWGGIQMMVARGNTGQISDAKDRITQALFGLLLLAGAYIILNTINPKLTDLSLPKLETVREVGEAVANCNSQNHCGPASLGTTGCCELSNLVCKQIDPPPATGDTYKCSSFNENSKYVLASPTVVSGWPPTCAGSSCTCEYMCSDPTFLSVNNLPWKNAVGVDGKSPTCSGYTVAGKEACHTLEKATQKCFIDLSDCQAARDDLRAVNPTGDYTCIVINNNQGTVCPVSQ